MTRDEIIRMARKAGFVVDEISQDHQPNCIFHTHHMVDELLARFAALVAERDTSLLRQALEALEHHVEQTRPIHRTSATIAALRARLGVNT